MHPYIKSISQRFGINKLSVHSKTVLMLVFVLNTFLAVAQPEKPNVLPPSMDNYNFTKYGGLEMSNNNGGFAYTAPLYSIKHAGINVPVSLNYYTDGVKVNDIAGIAGMGWNLMAGGMITRVVKDQPDEFAATVKYRPETAVIDEIIGGNYTDAYYLTNIKQKAMDLWNTIYNNAGGQYYNKLDTEQDAFSFNFNGHSGSFYIENNQIYLDTDENEIKASFEKVVIGAYNYLKFTFITPDGLKYTFGGSAEFVESSEIAGDCAKNYMEPIPTSWHLKEIESNGQVVKFTYKTIFKYYPFDYSQMVVYNVQEDSPGCPPAGIISDCLTNFTTSNAKVLTQIDFGTSKVKFNYLTQRADYYAGHLLSEMIVNDGFQDVDKINFEYVYSLNNSLNVPNTNTLENKKRAFLQKIIYKNNSIQQFDYNTINGISPRTSYSQDIYGYSNGNTVASLLNVNYDGQPDNPSKSWMKNKFLGLIDKADRSIDPVKSLYGVLSKITYPTKGYSVINYQNNLNLETLNVKKVTMQSLDVRKTLCQTVAEDLASRTLTFTANGSPISILAQAVANSCSTNDIDFLHDRHSLTIKNVTTGVILYSKVNDFNEHFLSNETVYVENGADHNGSIFLPIGTVSGQQYSVTYGVSTNFDDVRGNIIVEYNSYYVQEPTVVNYGGARVQSIADYDANGVMYNKTDYVYNKVTDLTSGRTSLHHNYFYSPWFDDCVSQKCFPEGRSTWTLVDCKNVITFGTNNYLGGLASRGNRINYETVSAILANKNATENRYYVNDGTADQPVIVHRLYLDNTTRSNPVGWHDGKLEETIIYNFQGGIYVPAKSIKTKYEVVSDVSFFNYNVATGIKTDTHFSAMDLEHVTNNVEYVGCNTLICNIRAKLKIEKYFNHCTVRAKTETIETEYFKGNPVVNTTKYYYTSPSHRLLSSQTSTNSKGETLQSKFFYAPDAEMASQPFRSQLIASNTLQPPLQTQTFNTTNNNTKLSEQLMVYDNSAATSNLLLPKITYSAKFPNTFPLITGVGNLEKKITYDKYDDKGNLLQYTTESGMPVSIIWGYNKTQPIAKVENAAYSAIEASVLNLQNLSNADNDNCMPAANCKEELLRKALTTLRTSFPQFMISTYTYNPLIGVTSITDSKGIPTYYEYDTSNRLKHIIDKDLNVAQKYCYNYKGQVIDCNILANVVVYSSIARSGSFTRNNCAGGMIASSVTYSQGAGAVTSTISQADADAKGLTKFNLDGQAYANANGTCTGVTFNAVGVQDILLKKMFVTLTASSSNHTGHTFNIEIVYDTATNPTNYKTVVLELLNGETSKTFTVAVPALSNAEIVSF
ncbi:DUF5977 domain-containing protein [Flavobacterium sp. LAR06]|uniref:DUF5977 domain-containing protein n=1 Tax=Flavobacterium sp. LAR06 TaxID=3064897 RepID=UPI0035BF3CA1